MRLASQNPDSIKKHYWVFLDIEDYFLLYNKRFYYIKNF